MDVSKTNPSPIFALSDSDEFAMRRKKLKKTNEESVVIDKPDSYDSLCSLLEDKPVPNLPNIEEIRKRMENGEYQVDYEKLASKILQLEKLWLND